MRRLKRFAVLVLLAALSFPAVSQAKSAAGPSPGTEVGTAPRAARVESSKSSTPTPSSGASLAELAAREQQAKQLADFRGGDVYIYAGSGAVLVLVIVLLILIV